MAKLNVETKTMDLHFSIIPQKVSGVTIPSDTWEFMSKVKISELLGISDFIFSFNNSFAIPSVDFGYTDIAKGAGKSGFIIGENSMSLGRIYTESGNAGTWGINSSLYEKLSGKQISIDIYGATYS